MDLLLCDSILVRKYLDFCDIQNAKLVCWKWYMSFGSKEVEKMCLRNYGVPDHCRIRFWMMKSGAFEFASSGGGLSTYLEHTVEGKELRAMYPDTDILSRSGVVGEITRDVHRTFAARPLFRGKDGIGQVMLYNILVAIAHYEPNVGYCQGMNFVVAIMILASLNIIEENTEREKELCEFGLEPRIQDEMESNIFWLMVAVLYRFDMCELWRPGVPQLKLRIYQFDRLLASKLPRLAVHFREIGLAPDFMVSQWFLTLMSYNVPPKLVVRIWDVLFSDGWKTVFRFAIHFLRSQEKELLKRSMDQLSDVFRVSKQTHANNYDLLINAFSVKISTQELADLEGGYISHIIMKRLDEPTEESVPNGQPSKDLTNMGDLFVDHRLAATFRNEIGTLDQKTKQDVEYLRSKIEEAERERKLCESEFKQAARHSMEIQEIVRELEASKKAVSDQLISITNSPQTHESDSSMFLDKIELIDHRLRMIGEQFREAMWKTTQAQVDLEEAIERKGAFSYQLQEVLGNTENFKTAKLKELWESATVSRV